MKSIVEQRIQIYNSLSGTKEEFVPFTTIWLECMFVDQPFTTMFTLEIAELLFHLISSLDT